MYSIIGMCEYMNSNYKESINNLTNAITLIDKNDAYFWQNFAYRGASELELNDLDKGKDDLFSALKLNKNAYIIYDFLYTYYNKIRDFKLALVYFDKRGKFHEDMDDRYYRNGMGIYLRIISNKQEADPKKIQIYKKLAFEYGTKAYKLNPDANNQYNLCIAGTILNNETSPNKNCYEARDKAKQEKNDALYKEIDDAINTSVN